jgi:AraC-like DNA-binding protein
MRRAKQLLTDGMLTVSAIAEQCGFSSVYHFSRAFKQTTGLSPTAYAKQNHQTKL